MYSLSSSQNISVYPPPFFSYGPVSHHGHFLLHPKIQSLSPLDSPKEISNFYTSPQIQCLTLIQMSKISCLNYCINPLHPPFT